MLLQNLVLRASRRGEMRCCKSAQGLQGTAGHISEVQSAAGSSLEQYQKQGSCANTALCSGKY